MSQQYACESQFSSSELRRRVRAGCAAEYLSNSRLVDRAQKSLGIVGGSPDYESAQGFEQPAATSRLYKYSPDGRLFAYALPGRYGDLYELVCLIRDANKKLLVSLRVHYAESAELLREFDLPNIVEFGFSPRGTYLTTWERPGEEHQPSV